MNGIEYELQVAWLARINQDARLSAAGLTMYDVIPSGVTFPYIQITDFSAVPYRSKTFEGLEVTADLSVFVENPGQGDVRRYLALVRAAMLEPLDLSREGHIVDLQSLDSERVIRIQDEEVVTVPIWQGVQTYRFLIKEGSATV